MLDFFKRFRANNRLKKAVAMADKTHALTGERYYVLPSPKRGELIVLDRKNFRGLKRKHYIEQKWNIRDLEERAFYFTPYRDGSGALHTEDVAFKRSQYLSWCLR